MSSVRATICQYDMNTDKKINEYTGTFNIIFNKIPNFKDYYYRFKMFENTSREKVVEIYYGIRVQDIGSLETNVADYMNKRLNYYIQKWIDENDKPLKGNHLFDNLAYWYLTYENHISSRLLLDKESYRKTIEDFLKNNPSFYEVFDLNELNNVKGIYLLILDNYCTYYIGQSNDMKKRIKQHWNRKNYWTGTGIDLYKPKDTTQVFVLPTSKNNLDKYEKEFVKYLAKYSNNVLPGGHNISIDEISEHIAKKVGKRLSLKETLELVEQNPDIFVFE